MSTAPAKKEALTLSGAIQSIRSLTVDDVRQNLRRDWLNHVAGGFRDMHTLTVFADYRLPQLARAEGIFEFDNTLAARIDDGAPIAPGSSEEVHLRAAVGRAPSE